MYLLDSDVLIQPKNGLFAFDVCPGYWEWLIHGHNIGRIFSVPDVKREILNGDDDLKEWVKSLPNSFFCQPDYKTVRAYAEVSRWVEKCEQYKDSAVADFFDKADYHLVSHSLAHGQTIVTFEVSEAGSTARIKIPDACEGVHAARCISLLQLLRREKVAFIAKY